MLKSFIFAFAFYPIPLSLPTDSYLHTLYIFFQTIATIMK